MKKEKRIPTLLGLLVLGGGLIAGVLLNGKSAIFQSKASSDCKPLSPSLTNLTDKSVDVSFFTSADCLSTIQVNNKTIENIFTDKSKTHYFSVTDLKPSTTYTFSFISGGTTYIHDSFKIKTFSKPSGTPPSSNLAWGKVLDQNKQPSVKTIIYLNIPNSQPLSAITTSTGNWNVSLANSFKLDGSGWFTPEDNLSEDFVIVTSNGKYTQITGNTSNNSPVPDIIIGQDQLNSPTSIPTVVPTTLPTSKPLSVSPIIKDLKILNPAEGETVTTLKPNFFGTASSNSIIQIKIVTASIADQVTADSTGAWSWSPAVPLSLGPHTLTITSQSKNVSRNFIVTEKTVDTPAFTASGSGQLVTPTIVPTDTPIPTIRTAKPTTAGDLPTSGVAFPTYLPLILSAILIITSVLIFKY